MKSWRRWKGRLVYLLRVHNLWMKLGHARAVLGRKTEVLVLGDSHANIFLDPRLRRRLPNISFSVVAVGGATASGLDNPNSLTQAHRIFSRAISSNKAALALVLLGEVDTGFVIWYRASKHGADVARVFEQTLGIYERFLMKVSERCKLAVISAPLPTIEDGNDWGKVANERREITATQRERTDLTLAFNRKVQEICEQHGFGFVDLDAECLGENGLVKDTMLNPNRCDHHYDSAAFADLLARKLKVFL
jgi:hypothetical protein